MQNRTPIFIGAALIGIGLMAVINALFHVDLWVILFPLLLIGIGAWIIVRPNMMRNGENFRFLFLGDIKKSGFWQVTPEEIWLFVGDITFDFREAELPLGETEIKIISFVNDLRILSPREGALKVNTNAFVSSSKIHGNKRDHIISPLQFQDANYDSAAKKVVIQSWGFVGETRVE